MPQRWTRTLLSLLAISLLFASCKKQYSSDDPLPPTYNPSIFIGNDNNFVYAFDPLNGEKHWEYNVGDKIIASPLLYKEVLYIMTQDDSVFKLNAKTGVLIKRFFVGHSKSGSVSTPIADGDLIYYGMNNDTLYAYDANADTMRWKYGTGGQIQASPTIANGQVIISSQDGKLYSLDKTNGTLAWRFNSGISGNFYSSPSVGGPFVYVGGKDGKMYSVNASTGTLNWTFQTQGAIESSPLPYGGNLLFGSDDYHFYCIDTASGLPRWVDSTGDRIVSSPYAVNQVIYFGDYDYNLYAIHILDGAVKWTYKTNALISSSPLVYGSNVYIGGYDKYLYALDTASGTLTWKQNTNGIIESSPVVDDLSGTNSFNSSISGYPTGHEAE